MIRSVKTTDIPRILEIYKYYVQNTAITFEYEVPTLEEMQERMKRTTQKYPYLVVEVEGVVMGYAYAGPFVGRAAYDWASELSIYLDCKMVKSGLGRALYQELEKRLCSMGILNLYACIASPIEEDEYLTKNSVHFHKALGFEVVGEFHKCGYKFDRWYDMVWAEKIIGKHGTNQPPVRY